MDVIYEQPLNEQIRLCLRLEYLFFQVDHYRNKTSFWDSHQLIKIILEILQVTDRPDLKNKFFQNLNQYFQVLSQLEKVSKVDKKTLDYTLKQIKYFIDGLHNDAYKIGQKLRENDFLASIQQRLSTPAGTSGSSLPAYHLWLQQSDAVRNHQISSWLEHLTLLRGVVALILKLVRESSLFSKAVAVAGFYQSNLDPSVPNQLIRVKLAANVGAFPECSIGRYRLTVHFFCLNPNGHTTQLTDDLSFQLACCKL